MNTARYCLPGAAAIVAGMLTLAGCETTADAVKEGRNAVLSGDKEVPGPGDPDGSGKAEITVIDAADNVCFDLKVSGIGPATAAHIHRGAIGVAGPPVVMLKAPANGESDGCVSTPGGIADEIDSNPQEFYVNVHNDEYPGGAIRGQLSR